MVETTKTSIPCQTSHFLIWCAVIACIFVSVRFQAIPGIPMNLLAVVCLTLAINTWGSAMYNFNDIPEYFLTNTTVSSG